MNTARLKVPGPLRVLAILLTGAGVASFAPSAPDRSLPPPASPSSPLESPDSIPWVPLTARCLRFVYGEDRSTWAEGALPEDHWITVHVAFEDTTDFEFGLLTTEGFVAYAEPGVTSARLGLPPQSLVCWAIRHPASGRVISVEEAGVIAVDPASRVPGRLSVDPRLTRDYHSRARLLFDRDGDGIPDLAIMVSCGSPEGFHPEPCKDD